MGQSANMASKKKKVAAFSKRRTSIEDYHLEISNKGKHERIVIQ